MAEKTDKSWEEILFGIAQFKKRELPILKSAPTDCYNCGACCEYYSIIDVDFGDANYAWLKENGYLKEVITHGADVMKQVDDRRCIALVGEIGKDAKCSIYEHRPDGCRDYKEGSYRCRNAIIEKLHRDKGCN